MQQTDYSMIVLTKEQKQIFKKFNKSNSAILTIDELKTMDGTALLEQAIDGKSTWFDVNVTKGVCKLSKHGIKYQAYLEEQKKLIKRDSFRFWLPITISLISLIGAYRQELLWLLHQLMRLMK